MYMKIVYRKDRDRWQVTHYLKGKRERPLFQSRKEAEDFVCRHKRLNECEPSKLNTTIESAITDYYRDISSKKSRSSRMNERRYFNLMFGGTNCHHFFGGVCEHFEG